MQTPLEVAKGRTLKEIGPILLEAFLSGPNPDSRHFSWRRDRLVKAYEGGKPDRTEEAEKFIEWCLEDNERLQEFLATRSPSMAAELSVKYQKRLCPPAEKIVTEKAKDRPKLLEYCSHWGIILGDMSKVTMRAAFAEDATKEKAYIKKIQHTKKKMKEFLEQMVSNGMMDSGATVKELIETL